MHQPTGVDVTDVTFGALLRHLRIRAGLSQRELAAAVGYSESQISRLEQQQRQPDPTIVRTLFVTALDLDTVPELAVRLIALAETDKDAKRQADKEQRIREQVPLPTSSATLATALPVPLTPLINRTRELAAVGSTLLRQDVRLLTLTGPPGIGKTRLSLQVADSVQSDFADGAAFVPLAPVHDPMQVIPTIARTLGLVESSETSLGAALRDREMLLVLDNFEQVIEAAPSVAQLLRMAPRVKALVTSRTPLQVSGEHQYAVPVLEMPDVRNLPALHELLTYPAIQLFVERMHALRPDFALTAENAPAVVELCARLDGLPLAIELAVARSKLLTPQALLERLRRTSALTLLVNGPSDLLAHQQTLRSTMEWSYALLDPAEQTVLRHLAVFVGGCTAAAVAVVCDNELAEVEDLLGTLVNHSLLTFMPDHAGVTRFVMLETIREYGLEQLQKSNDLLVARRRHASYYAALAADAAPHLTGADQDRWLDDLQADEPNLEATLSWLLEHDVETGLRCAANLHQFWLVRGFISEGRVWLARLLDRCSCQQAATSTTAWALHVAGALAYEQGDHREAELFADQSLQLHRVLDDQRGCVAALTLLGRVALGCGRYVQAEQIFDKCLALYTQMSDLLGVAQMHKNLAQIAKDQGDFPRATALHTQALAIYRQLGHRRGIAQVLINLSIVAYWQGAYAHAGRLAEEGLAIHRELDDRLGIAYALDMVGMIAYKLGDFDQARRDLAEGLSLFRALNEQIGTAMILHEMGLVAQAQDQHDEAMQLQQQGLAIAWSIGDQRRVAFCLEGLANAHGATQPLLAARLFAAASALRDSLGTPVPPAERAAYDAGIVAARAYSDSVLWDRAWTEGRESPLEQVVGELLV